MFEIIYLPLAWLGEDGIIWAVSGLLIVFFVLGLTSERFRQIAPSLMVSLGILGTFCGIFIALYPLDFSPGKVNDSIETLLNGMKTAFVTSLLGIFLAIVFRVIGAPLSTSINTLLPGLMKPEKDTSEQREILVRLDAIKQAIAGEGDSSMVTQMQKMRDENRDGFKKLDGLSETIRNALVDNLKSLIEEIRDIVGRQLGESLQNLINSIEKALIEQFGETFVEFNAATQAIKKWQEGHRREVEQLTAAFDLVAKGISQIKTDCEKIPPTMEQLREITGVAHHNVEALNRQVEAFAAIRQQAEEAFPVIKKHLDKVGVDLENSAAGFAGLEKTIRTTFQSAEQEVRRIAQQHSENVQSMATRMRETLEKNATDSTDKVTGIVASAIEQFSKEINGEINRITKEWGGNMVSIAERCEQTINKVENSKLSDKPS